MGPHGMHAESIQGNWKPTCSFFCTDMYTRRVPSSLLWLQNKAHRSRLYGNIYLQRSIQVKLDSQVHSVYYECKFRYTNSISGRFYWMQKEFPWSYHQLAITLHARFTSLALLPAVIEVNCIFVQEKRVLFFYPALQEYARILFWLDHALLPSM